MLKEVKILEKLNKRGYEVELEMTGEFVFVFDEPAAVQDFIHERIAAGDEFEFEVDPWSFRYKVKVPEEVAKKIAKEVEQ